MGKAVLKIRADYAFGTKGSETHNVPAHTDVVVDIELVSVENPKQPYEIVDYERCFAEASALKAAGNALFKDQNFANAIRRYTSAIKFSEKDSGFSDEEKKNMKAVTVSCHLNSAQCHLKLKRAAKAKAACDKVLALDSDSIKGLFRRGTALLDMGEYSAAQAVLKRCLALDAENKAAA